MTIPKEPSDLLDLGCGYGAIGMVLGYESPQSKIVFVEVNRRAIWCTKENIKINLPNSKDRITTLTGNFLEPLKNKKLIFDGIYMNPPLREGRRKFLDLCRDIPNLLKPKGYFEFVIKKKMGSVFILNYLNQYFSKENYQTTVLTKRSGYWVFRLSKN
jgi:16S rRNA (guanine1207-N2)-methyltransferase